MYDAIILLGDNNGTKLYKYAKILFNGFEDKRFNNQNETTKIKLW